MPLLRLLSASGQVAAHLRRELARGRWSGTMPGVNRLAADLGVNHKTVEAALRQLQREGLLAGQGAGRRRRIERPGPRAAPMPLRVALLPYEAADLHVEYLLELQHALAQAGHTTIVPAQSLTDLRMEVPRIARLAQETAADAWVVCAGQRAVLEWFAAQPVRAFALFGRREGLPIAATGPDTVPAYIAATRQLIGLGHRRITLLARRLRRLPEPGRSERAFLGVLTAHGMATSPFNLPDWEETREGFQRLLVRLFQVTPPTAIIVDEAPLFIATLQFLAGRRLRVPQDVSLVSTDPDPAFAWCQPPISHIRWDYRSVVRRIMRWVASVARGHTDLHQTAVPAEFVTGGTIGRTPAG